MRQVLRGAILALTVLVVSYQGFLRSCGESCSVPSGVIFLAFFTAKCKEQAAVSGLKPELKHTGAHMHAEKELY